MKQIVFLCAFSLFLLTGCHGVGGHVRVGGGYSYPQHMPPSHAPAHGRYRYHYYPNAEIYFDIGRNMYFYLDSRNQWSFSVNLPIHLRSHLHNGYVEIEMENERPYSRHKYHKQKYKNYKFKNKRQYDGKQRYEDRGRYEDRQKYKSKDKNYRKNNRRERDDYDNDRRHYEGERYEKEGYDDRGKYKSKDKKYRKKNGRDKDESDSRRRYEDERYKQD
ncbi:MAG: hypothetical protein OEW99_02870 [Gammaproteobacteria bacterium]|nr:hypothetical protein [Gammaproteobacteria bacterium]